MRPTVDKLRRFSLGASLALIAYNAAGIQLKAGETTTIMGVPFEIARPDLLGIAFSMATAYGLIRFIYYGVMLGHSPARRRKDVLHRLHAVGEHGTYRGSVFIGPVEFETTPSLSAYSEVQVELRRVLNAFPKVGKHRATGDVVYDRSMTDEGLPWGSYRATIRVPVICRVAAVVQDIDYLLPVWFSAIALLSASLL
jgi:hypothetical protein